MCHPSDEQSCKYKCTVNLDHLYYVICYDLRADFGAYDPKWFE